MDPELVLGAIQTIFGILAVAIAAVQLVQQWPRHVIKVNLVLQYSVVLVKE